jgi:hypothetical protein
VGSEIADNYEARTAYCQASQVLGDQVVGNFMRPYKHTLHDRCQALDGAEDRNKHILRPKIVLNDKQECIQDWESQNKFCGVAKSGCKKQPPMGNLCLNIVNQTIENCIIVDPKPGSACGTIDNIEQSNNCCAEGNCDGKPKNQCSAPCRWNEIKNKCESGCLQKSIAQSTTKNRINVKGLAEKENVHPSSIGPHEWDGSACSDPRFASKAACNVQFDKRGSMTLQGDPYAVGQGTAVDAAARCASETNCTAFVMRGNKNFMLMESADPANDLKTAPVEFSAYITAN